jgi:hypothetical protein
MNTSEFPAYQPLEQKSVSQGPAREHLQHLYRAIGISAVAAAAAQVARPESKPTKPEFELPACLRDEDDDLAA